MRIQIVSAILCCAVPGATLGAQLLEVSTQMEVGTGSGALGLGIAITRGDWGGYVRGNMMATSQGCAASYPPQCEYPAESAREYAVGVRRILTWGGDWTAQGSLGVGFVAWNGLDGLLELEAVLRRHLGESVALLIGIRAEAIPSVERERDGPRPIVGSKSVFFLSALAGVQLRVGRSGE